MKIFLISRGYPSEKSPQWGCFEKDQAEALAALGHKVVMLSYDGRFRLYWRRLGIETKTVNGVTSINAFFLPSKIVGLMGRTIMRRFEEWQLRLVYDKAVKLFGEPDVLYSHYLFLSNIALTLKRHYAKPLVAIEHWSELNNSELSVEVVRLGKATYANVDKLVVVSQSLKDSVKKNFGVDSVVVHNMLGKEFLNKVEPYNYSNDMIRFISVGSLIERKRIDLVLNAFSRIKRSDWEYVIIGDGPQKNSLKALVRELGIEKKVKFIGKKTKSEILYELKSSDVFVLASVVETFGVVVIEAMSCGLPVIATRCGGPEYFVGKEDGVLVDVDNVECMVQKIEEMMDKRMMFMREDIAKRCTERFSPSVIAKQLTGVFESVLPRKSSQK